MFSLSCHVLLSTQCQVRFPTDERAWNSRINDKANRPFLEREPCRKYVPDRAQAVDRGSLLFGEARGKRLSFDTGLRGICRKPLVFAASRKEM